MAGDLTPGAITMLLNGEYTALFKPVVQVIDIVCTRTETIVNNSNGVVEKKGSYRIVLSDGGLVCKDVAINDKINGMIRSNHLQIGSFVQLTRFSSNNDHSGSYILLYDLNVILCKTPSVETSITPKLEEEPVENFITPKLEEEPVDPDVNDDRHHADEPTASKQKCLSCSQTQSRKRQRQSSDYKEDDEIGACFEKLEKLGCGEGPMYDTAVLLFGESSDYRKIWLHLKPKSSLNWVKNAGSKYGLLG